MIYKEGYFGHRKTSDSSPTLSKEGHLEKKTPPPSKNCFDFLGSNKYFIV